MAQKILVIDDGKTIRMQVRDMLPQGSFEFLEAKDGVEGLDLIREVRPNIVLLDFFMPRMNGWEVLEQMQAQPELQSIPLVLMSGRKEEVIEKVPDVFERFEFIEKPFGQKALIGALRSAIAKSRAPKPAAIAKPSPAASATNSVIPALNAKLDQMQTDIDSLKKQLAQITGFIKQKLK